MRGLMRGLVVLGFVSTVVWVFALHASTINAKPSRFDTATLATVFNHAVKHMTRSAFRHEFAALQANTEPEPGAMVTAELPAMTPLNRYRDILALDRTRVVLQTSPTHDYINANWVRGPRGARHYVVGQGPVAATVGDFLRLIWEQRVPVVVMLTGYVEQGWPKCARYLEGDATFHVNIVEQHRHEFGWWVDSLVELRSVEDEGAETFTFHHIHYLDWPDHGVPDTTAPVLALVRHANAYITSSEHPMLVHCSAGVGRSGTFCAINNVCRAMDEQRQAMDAWNDVTVNVYEQVSGLRRDRAHMVQNVGQYEFVYRAVGDYLSHQVLDELETVPNDTVMMDVAVEAENVV